MTSNETKEAVHAAVRAICDAGGRPWTYGLDRMAKEAQEVLRSPAALHEAMVQGCVAYLADRTPDKQAKGSMVWLQGSGRDDVAPGTTIMLPFRTDMDTQEVRRVLRWMIQQYRPRLVGAAVVISEAMPVQLSVDLKGEVTCEHEDAHHPRIMVVTCIPCDGHGTHTRTTFLDESGDHRFDCKVLAGGDPRFTELFDRVFDAEEGGDKA